MRSRHARSQEDHLATNLAPEAVKILAKILKDEKVQSRLRVDAAKAILDRSGFAAGNGENSGVSGDVHEMSLAQLEAFIAERECKMKVVGASGMAIDAEVENSDHGEQDGDPGPGDGWADTAAAEECPRDSLG